MLNSLVLKTVSSAILIYITAGVYWSIRHVLNNVNYFGNVIIPKDY